MIIREVRGTPDTSQVIRRASSLFLAAGLAGIVAMAVVPPATAASVFSLLAVAGTVATWAGARLWLPRGARRPWHLIAAGEALCLTAGIVRAASTPVGATPSPLPSVADAFYIAGYLCLIAAVRAFDRARRGRTRHDIADRIDSLIVSAGAAVPVWLFAMTSFARQQGLPLEARTLAVGYSVLTLVMLSGIAGMAMGLGVRNRSHYLLLAGFACLIVVDVLTTMSSVIPPLNDVATVVAGILYVLPAAAALHPTMRLITDPPATPRPPVGWHRLSALIGALCVAPVALAVAELTGVHVDGATIVVGASIISFLVLARMWLLVRTNELRAAQERALRAAGQTFVACTTRDQMLRGAVDAIVELAGGRADLSGHVLALDPVTAEVGLVASTPDAAPLAVTPELVTDPPADTPDRTVLRLISQNEVRGALVVWADEPLPEPLVEALAGLAATLSLALETAALVEDLHVQRSERRFRALIERSSDMIVILDERGAMTYVSPGCTRVLGYLPDDVLGRPMQTILHRHDVPALDRVLTGRGSRAGEEPIELRATDVHGDWHVLEVTAANLLHDDDVAGIVLNARDTTERKKLADELRHQALHDTLTGLANRALLGDRVAHALARRSDSVGLVAVLFIDLDDFKTVNDSLGHGVGDRLLVLVADRLRSCLRTADTAARLGGDEFAILLDEPADEDQVVAVAERLLAALQQPFLVDGHEIVVTASVGIAVDPARAATAEHLLRNADAAMYLAKQRGKGRWERYDEQMHTDALERLELRTSLARAVDEGELEVHYQPIVELATGRTVAVEALARWNHPTRGPVSPAQFIPVAEETGLIVPMGRWILQRACRDLAARPSGTELGLTVNVSVRQLYDKDLVEDVLSALTSSGLAASRLTIEITESILMVNTDQALDRLTELRDHGVGIAIDDFGSGYSSLGYLQRFPVTVLKLDRSFVDDLQLDRPVGGVVRAIVELADGLGVRLVAEGIETADQAEALRRRGCRYGQGYLYARPVPVTQLDVAVRGTDGIALPAPTALLVS